MMRAVTFPGLFQTGVFLGDHGLQKGILQNILKENVFIFFFFLTHLQIFDII